MSDTVVSDATSASRYGTAARFALGGAVVGSAIVALSTFWSVCNRDQQSKRKLAEIIPGAIDDSCKAFKQAFAAVEGGEACTSPNVTPTLSDSDQESELTTMRKGYAYGANAERQQWFVARWQETTAEMSVRVEYLSTMDGHTSSLALPSQKKTTILKAFVREDAPSDPFVVPLLER